MGVWGVRAGSILHELGHAFGVAGHVDDNTAVVSFGNSTTITTITEKDTETLKIVYGESYLTTDGT